MPAIDEFPSRVWFIRNKKSVLTVAIIVLLVIVLTCVAVAVPLSQVSEEGAREKRQAEAMQHARQLLSKTPLIDGHNDLPWQLFKNYNNEIGRINLRESTKDKFAKFSHTDIPRLKEGQVGAQFWAAYVSCKTQFKDAVTATLRQIDVIHRFVDKYPDIFEFARTADDIERIFANGKIASMIGVEGGHSIDSSLATLRMMYNLGTRYMTITHSCPTPWADNWNLDENGTSPIHSGLTPFGEKLIREMNRIGMLVDLSHVSKDTMLDALRVSESPVIFSHSSAFGQCNHYRNVQDDVLPPVKRNGGVIMINFYNKYISCDNTSTLDDVVQHFKYLKDKGMIDHIGIGADYDGVPITPTDLEDVSTYPNLIAALVRDGWSDDELNKIIGLNLLRVMRGAESKAREMQARPVEPIDDVLDEADINTFSNNLNDTAEVCRINYPSLYNQ